MSEVRLVIRDASRSIHETRHGSFADRVVAALSAEPETIEELDRAVQRYEAHDERSFFSGFRSGTSDEPYDAGLIIIDLEARLVVCQSTYSAPGRTGTVSYHNGRCALDISITYHLPEDWEFTSHVECWHGLANRKRRERRDLPALDARDVLYGKPMLKFVAGSCWKAFREAPASVPAAPRKNRLDLSGQGDRSAATRSEQSDPEYEMARETHAQWMLKPREDLRGQAPRDVMLAKHHFITCDLRDRQAQWTAQQKCAPGLDRNSHAFRFGGFGTHEIVLYYDLVRDLICSSQRECQQTASQTGPLAALEFRTVGDFFTTEIPRLERMRDKWLDSPGPVLHGHTPRTVIDHERTRIPERVSGKDAVIDPDCRTLADLPGPTFRHLDGSDMDPDFAFSFHRSRREWEDEQRECEEFSRRFQS